MLVITYSAHVASDVAILESCALPLLLLVLCFVITYSVWLTSVLVASDVANLV